MYKKCVSRQSVGIWGYDRRTRLESIDFTSRTEQSSRKDGEEGVGVVGPRSGSNNADFDEEESTTMLLLGSPNGIPCKIRDSPRVSTRRPRTRSWNPWTKETSLRSFRYRPDLGLDRFQIADHVATKISSSLNDRRGKFSARANKFLHNHQDFSAIAQTCQCVVDVSKNGITFWMDILKHDLDGNIMQIDQNGVSHSRNMTLQKLFLKDKSVRFLRRRRTRDNR